MTSRERIHAALNHEEADRVPIDFGGSRVTGIAGTAYKRLLDHLGVEEDIKIYDIKQQLADPSVEMIKRMGGDCAQLTRLGPTTGMPFLMIDRWEKGQMTDGTPCLVPEGYEPEFLDDGAVGVMRDGKLFAIRPEGSLYFDVCGRPLEHAETPADIDAWKWPDPWTDREADYIKARAEYLYNETDLAIFAGMPLMNGSFFEIGHTLFGYETFMMNLMLKRDLMEYWLESMLEHDLEILDKFLGIAGDYISVIQLNDDLGAQDALQLSPAMYRDMFKPRQRKWIEFVKQRSNAKVFFHCDGAISEILDDFIEIGIDILNPLQTSAEGMEPGAIKKRFGDNICFWGGGSETQTTLPFGTVEEVARESAERVRLLGPGGGYVFTTIHNIQPDIPPEKIMAVFGAALENGTYPIH